LSIFFNIDDGLINFDDPTALVKDEYREYFARRELAPYLFSEICVLDMVLALSDMNDGYYLDRLVLKGGLSVRNHVPLIDHRFSFDADYNPNTQGGYTFGDVDEIRKDFSGYGARKGCKTTIGTTRNDTELFFLEFDYRSTLRERRVSLVEVPKIELCKRCRVFEKPAKSPMNTFIDLELLGLEAPVVYHVALEEQLATKLFIIGSSGRQRNHFDAYDVMRIIENNKIDWRLTKALFERLVERHRAKVAARVEECRRQLDAMLRNDGKRSSLQDTVFRKDFNFDEMVRKVKSTYDFKG
jgi:predicted nucleotidyltransferase component of viral defense system